MLFQNATWLNRLYKSSRPIVLGELKWQKMMNDCVKQGKDTNFSNIIETSEL